MPRKIRKSRGYKRERFDTEPLLESVPIKKPSIVKQIERAHVNRFGKSGKFLEFAWYKEPLKKLRYSVISSNESSVIRGKRMENENSLVHTHPGSTYGLSNNDINIWDKQSFLSFKRKSKKLCCCFDGKR
jgi:hypothetical protein